MLANPISKLAQSINFYSLLPSELSRTPSLTLPLSLSHPAPFNLVQKAVRRALPHSFALSAILSLSLGRSLSFARSLAAQLSAQLIVGGPAAVSPFIRSRIVGRATSRC